MDTETSSLDPHQAELVGVSLCSKIGKACYIPIGHKSSKCIDKNIVIKKLKPLLEDPSVCLLYTSDAADEEDSVDLGGRRIIKKKKKKKKKDTH